MEKQELHGRSLFVVHGLLGEDECARVIEQSERQGYTEDEGPSSESASRPKGRSCGRCPRVDGTLAGLLWSRLAPFLPPLEGGGEPHGVAERFLLFRYRPGQGLLPVQGGMAEEEGKGLSGFRFLVSLNEGCEGGETVCYPVDGPVVVVPQQGQALVLPTHWAYEEMPVRQRWKYVLQGEVLCR